MKPRFASLRLGHLKRDYIQAADYLTSKALLIGEYWDAQEEDEFAHFERVPKITEMLMKPESSVNVASFERNPQEQLSSVAD
ncbi:hypothetical protein PC123_g883 [Phytophthora cactorum]|nr:hypothetical protein PC123_g883 [Phytophthora cactorum]